jgi:predicted secreted protein
MKKRKIINIVLVACVVIGIFFIIKFDLVGKIENIIYQQKIKNEISNEANEN